ncbi:elongation factor G [Actinophytocola oryzae]|uniref:Ribosomal protection tetracycline resistance protein n=1 Tax=Actinophytocola oryzae TaxID=502181 RepID=A0A4V3FU47_9PSEU|nr:TetM/TetW/TetO/TetS family tetracycline resistance ribosomal protection protein [Actinophytocola oryzae]TDV53761.1 ribosomal protection tetracycline resistance protein [Actinophytocola oryzae]
MPTLNLGILAHVDAGKTSLTERLLLDAGVIDELGSVDAGSTQTDSMALERRRGITIRSAVVSFRVDDTTVNIIDTPGHPDFIAEVERVLSVLDGAVLVVSAVEGVQAQTRVLMRTLRRLRIPTLVFVNKTDRRGADPDRVIADLNARLAPAIVPDDLERLAEHDDVALAAYLEGRPAPDRLVARTRDVTVHPVFTGSAVTGAGIAELTEGIVGLLPAADGDVHAPTSGTVFKVERGPAGEKVAFVRMFAGTLRVRDRVPLGEDRSGKVTALRACADDGAVVAAGGIARVWGLADVRVGDTVGLPRPTRGHHAAELPSGAFPPPTLETVVDAPDRAALYAALTRLAEQDPLINLRLRDELSVSLYGEVQKEVIEATLREDHGVAVTFRESTTIHIERPTGVGAAVRWKEKNPYAATVGLRVEPGPPGSGVEFRLAVELGSLPLSFFTAVEEALRAELRHGRRWEVTDCVVTMTHSGYFSPVTTAGHFRELTRQVLREALAEAGTRAYEPVLRFRLEVPEDVVGTTLPALTRLGAVPHSTTPAGVCQVIEGEIPAARVHDLERRVPSLTRGEGVLESSFDHYRPV